VSYLRLLSVRSTLFSITQAWGNLPALCQCHFFFNSEYHWRMRQSTPELDFRCTVLRDIAACHKGVAKCYVLGVDVPSEGGSPSTQYLGARSLPSRGSRGLNPSATRRRHVGKIARPHSSFQKNLKVVRVNFRRKKQL
jgi:hypothetical protein